MSEQSIYPQSKHLPGWVKVVIWLAVLSTAAVVLAIFFTHGLVESAEGQLKALRAKNFSRAYYEFTSRDFKASTSLEAFQEFIKLHPALARNKGADFHDRSVDNNVGLLQATLEGVDGAVTPIEYKFVKEDDRWKILSMRLMPTGALQHGIENNVEKSTVLEPVEHFIAALKGKDIAKAYFGYTSTEFQENTSIKSFKEFVFDYPILSQHQHVNFEEKLTGEGKEATVDATFVGDKQAMVGEFRLIQDEGKWKIFSIRLNLPQEANSAKQASLSEAEAILAPLEAQLAYLRAGDFAKGYYDVSSQEFQATTSLDGFKDFLAVYPVLKDHRTVHFEPPLVHEDSGKVVADLQDAQGRTSVEYQMVRIGKDWKIWSMQITNKPGSNQPAPSFNTKDLAATIEDQLAALRIRDYSKAYYGYSSREFQRSTSLQAFEKFVRSQSVLHKNQSIHLTNLSFKNNIGTFQGRLTSSDNRSLSVEYDLTFEDGQWKILALQLLPLENDSSKAQPHLSAPSKEPSPNKEVVAAVELREEKIHPPKKINEMASSSIELARLVAGTELNEMGQVIHPRNLFPNHIADIHVDLYVRHGNIGDKTELILEHLESKTRVPAVETKIEEAGETVLSFVFTPPVSGWPSGRYRLLARTTTGQEKTFSFRVQ